MFNLKCLAFSLLFFLPTPAWGMDAPNTQGVYEVPETTAPQAPDEGAAPGAGESSTLPPAEATPAEAPDAATPTKATPAEAPATPAPAETPATPAPAPEKTVLSDSAEIGFSIKVWSMEQSQAGQAVCLKNSMLFGETDGAGPECHALKDDLYAAAVKGRLQAPLDIIKSLEEIGFASVIVSNSGRAKNHENIALQALRRDDASANNGSAFGFDLTIKPIIKEGGYLTLEYSLNQPKVIQAGGFPRQADLKTGENLLLAAFEEDGKTIIVIVISTEADGN